ncbi:hypothetical protein I4I83_10180 [Acidovorax cattleyae]|nr:hypothetical protein [Paracidovorax cattleyae]
MKAMAYAVREFFEEELMVFCSELSLLWPLKTAGNWPVSGRKLPDGAQHLPERAARDADAARDVLRAYMVGMGCKALAHAVHPKHQRAIFRVWY